MNRLSFRLSLTVLGCVLAALSLPSSTVFGQMTLTSAVAAIGGASVVTPEAATVDIYGNVYVAITAGSSNNIIEVPASGGPVVTLAINLTNVRGLVVDSSGNLYISQIAVATILKIPAGGGATTTIGSGLSRPWLMAIDSANNLYVADSANNRIVKISPSGTQTVLGFTGLNVPKGVAVDTQGNVFASSSVGDTVIELSQTGTQTTLVSGLSTPIGVAADASDNLYVIDTTGLKEYAAESYGTAIPVFTGLNNTGEGVVITPRGDLIASNTVKLYDIALDSNNIYDYGTPIGSTSGTMTFTFTSTLSKVLGAPIFQSNNAATVQYKDGGSSSCASSRVVAAAGTCILNVVFTPAQVGIVPGSFSLVDSSGNVLATVSLSGTGDAPQPVFSPGTQSTLLDSLDTPTGVAADLGGNVYVADTTRDVVTKTSSTGTVTTLAFTGITRPTGVAVDGAGSVYVSDASNNAIYKMTAAGVQSTIVSTGLSAPMGIAFDAFGNLYVADSGNKRIVKIDGLGNQTVVGFTSLANPAFVAVDTVGDVFVSDTGKIYEYSVGGSQQAVLPEGLSASAGIAVGADGSLYIADSGNGNVLVSPVSGPAFTLATGLSSPLGMALGSNGNLYIANSGAANVVLLDRSTQALSFPSTAENADSSALTAVVQNIGNTSLTVGALAVSSGFAQETPIGPMDCSSSSTVTPSGICNINVVFSPTSLGTNSGTAVLTDNALNATSTTQAIELTGTGIIPTTTSLGQTVPSTGNPVYGQSVIVTATVVPTSGSGTPAGTISFSVDGGSSSAGIVMVNGQASYSFAGLSAGQHSVVATYSGDTSNAGSNSSTFTFVVTPAVLTVAAVSQTRSYNAANAALTYTITGYVYTDTSSVVSGVPLLSTTATTTSGPNTYPITITAGTLAAGNYTFTLVAGSITVAQANNTITFPIISNVTYGAYPIVLGATAGSGLAVTYSVVSGNATVTNGMGAAVTITGIGKVTIAANQAGNTDYAAATQVTQTFTIGPATLTASANNLSRQAGQANPALTYTLSGFVYSDTPSAVGGTPVLSTTATTASPTGTYPIAITQGTLAAANYNFVFIGGAFTVTGSTAQSIIFGPIPNVTYGGGSVMLSATASSGSAVSYAVTGPVVLNSNNTLTIVGQGAVSVTASQVGNNTYAAATPVTQSFIVAPATLMVTPANVSRYINTANPTFTYTITGFVNGDSPTVVSGAPSISTTATVNSPTGSYPIAASMGTLAASNYSFFFATATLTVNPTPQTITFTSLPGVTYGAVPITLMATASSTLPVTYAVTGPATLENSTLTITGVGIVNVIASQSGNATYAVATPVAQSFIVAPAPLTVTASNATIAYGATIPSTFTYAITGFVNNDTQSVITGVPSISTTATSSSPGGIYPITPAVGSLAASNYIFSNFVAGVLTISADSQTITFAVLPNVPQSTTSIDLAATTSSGLPVTFTETGTAAVTLSGSVLTISGPGAVSVTASQPGNTSYLPAIPVTQNFTVTATTTTALTLSSNTANSGSSVTLAAKIAFTYAGSPTGTVSFYDGTTLLVPSSATLPSAVPITVSGLSATATLTTTSIPSGSTYVTAVYSGDSSYTGSTSGATADPILVIAPDFNVTASPNNLALAFGQSGTSVITVTPVGGYSDTLTFSCPSVPAFLTCSFSPQALNFYPGTGAGTTAQSTTLTVTATAESAHSRSPFLGGRGSTTRLAGIVLGLPALILLGFAGRRRHTFKRNLSFLMLAFILSGSLLALSGCGSSLGTSSGGTYNVPVTLSDGTGVSHVVTITVTVQ